MFFRLVLRKEKRKMLVTSSEGYIIFDQFTQYKGQKRKKNLLLCTVIEGRVGIQSLSRLLLDQLDQCATNVLGSSIFGQASTESCGFGVNVF